MNIKQFIDISDKLQRYCDLLDKSCNTTGTECIVQDTINISKNRLLTIKEYQTQIEDLIGYQETDGLHENLAELTHTRVKRGWFNFIGGIHKTLYGTLTEADGDYINTQIDRLFNDTNHVATLLANQTHIMQTMLGTQQKEINNIENHIIELDNEIVSFTFTISTINKYLTRNTMTITLLHHLNKLDKMLNEYELDLNSIIDAILFAKQGIIHPRLLSPKQLINSLQHIQTLEPLLQFPIPLRNKYAEELIRLSELDIIYNEPNIIYALSIPLLDDDTFDLYHLLPIPVKQNFDRTNTFACIVPNNDYIAVSTDRRSYFHLSKTDFTDCKFSQNSFICKQTQPIYHDNNHKSCEMQLFLGNTPNQLNTCDIKINSFDGSYWSKLRAPNSWIYSLPNPETIHILCPNTPTTRVTLSNSGILKLKSRCSGHSEIVTLSTSNTMTSTETHSYVPEFTLNLTKIYQDLNKNHTLNLSTIPIFHQYKTTVLDADDIKSNSLALEDIIKQAKEISTHKRAQQSTDTLANSLSYAAAGLGVLAAFLVAYKFSLFGKILTVFSCLKKTRRGNKHSKTPTYEKPIPLSIIQSHSKEDNHEPVYNTPQKKIRPPLPPTPTIHKIKTKKPHVLHKTTTNSHPLEIVDYYD